MIRAFVFDLDGALVETERRCFGRTAEEIV
jgi:hypothetical protein